ncbi:isopenicillin N synthase family dioxygenase [Halopseudomonas salegens]|uniref:2-oxoglutarate-dependent ethylene/succinate-forming enzyme n=1 Tax=Halopseudomonas salegens TaxID=1434072 RepID=A0A1H2HKK2_9GAMM|nr:2-oxoglutarate and iron-dependent oxygenase domain-containing protein [Halopseudomonas salegens]SDU32375.1 Isopenicillin N synthase [Halopseudomonas salegens]
MSAHTAFTELPVVDIHGLYSTDPAERQATADKLGAAARAAGFLYVTGHGVDPALIAGLRRQAQALFELPLASKERFHVGQSRNHSGYVPQGEEEVYPGVVDYKEAYDINYDLGRDDPRPMLGRTQWPELTALPGFRTDVEAYYRAALALGNLLFRGFALALGLDEDRFTRHISTPPSQLRLIHYPYNPDAPADQPGIGAHTDYECFTILLPTAPGLEVLNGAGEWIDAPVLPDAFVINIGDMLEALSNGEFVATQHRVRKVAEERYAFPLFCNLDYDTVIEPLPEFVSASRPARYPALVCGEHLFAQTAQTFTYLKSRLASGELVLPAASRPVSSFGQRPEAGICD